MLLVMGYAYTFVRGAAVVQKFWTTVVSGDWRHLQGRWYKIATTNALGILTFFLGVPHSVSVGGEESNSVANWKFPARKVQNCNFSTRKVSNCYFPVRKVPNSNQNLVNQNSRQIIIFWKFLAKNSRQKMIFQN